MKCILAFSPRWHTSVSLLLLSTEFFPSSAANFAQNSTSAKTLQASLHNFTSSKLSCLTFTKIPPAHVLQLRIKQTAQYNDFRGNCPKSWLSSAQSCLILSRPKLPPGWQGREAQAFYPYYCFWRVSFLVGVGGWVGIMLWHWFALVDYFFLLGGSVYFGYQCLVVILSSLTWWWEMRTRYMVVSFSLVGFVLSNTMSALVWSVSVL